MKLSKNSKYFVVLGLSLGLPGTIIGVFFLIYGLVENKVITWNIGLPILILVVVNTLYLMVRYAIKRKN